MKKIIFTILLSLLAAAGLCVTAAADNIGIDVYENNMTREEYYQQTIEQYAEFDYSDPNTTTDEQLFGEWDGSRWTQEPLLDYERCSALAEVEAAAKNAEGDYSRCKQLILDYYNKKFDTFNLANTSTVYSGDRYRLTLEMQMDNFFVRSAYGPYPLSKMLVSKEPKWHSSTVHSAVSGIIGSVDKRVTLHVYSLKKDGYTVKFNSSENTTNTPYIEATVNGTVRKYYATEDTYISAGDNQEKNYGEDPYLLAEESYTSINADATTDSYTRRSILKFDFSDINDTDEVTSATLWLYGCMEKSDNPVDSGIEKESKIVFILNDTSNNNWKGNEITWDYLDDCGWVAFSYDGTAGYVNQSMEQYFSNLRNYRASIMSFAHDLTYFAGYVSATKDETAAYHTIRLLIHKIRELDCDFTSTEQPSLNIYRVNEIPEIFARVRFSRYMTPEVFTIILKSVYEHCEAMVGSEEYASQRSRIWTANLKTSNIGAIQTRTLMLMGAIFNEFKAADAPLGEMWGVDSYNGGWLAVASNRFQICLENSVLPDGSTTDIPISYIWTNLNNYIEGICRYPGVYNFDANKIFSEWVIETMIRVGEYVSNISSPIYGQWQVGDGASYNTTSSSYLKRIYNTFPNQVSEHFKYIMSEGKEGKPTEDHTSFAGDETHTAVLRSGWDENAVALNIQSSSKYQHTHDDDLGITLMAYKNYLLADPTRYTYAEKDPISNWQISRAAHNTIMVDNSNSSKSGGSMNPEDREFNNVYDYLHADSSGYENQYMDRYVLFIRPGYYIVTDHIDSSDEAVHNYSQAWHFQPNANIYIDSDGQTHTQYPSAANLAVVPVAGESELESKIMNGYFTYTAQSVQVEDYKYVTYAKDVSGDTTFQTILYPEDIGKFADIQTEVLNASIPAPDARAMRAIIKYDGHETETNYYILLNSKKKADASYGNYKTDGTVSLTEYADGDVSTIILRNGSYIEDAANNRKIIVLANETEDIGISFENERMVIESSKDTTDIDKMTVYLGNKSISSAEFNGKTVSYTVKGRYVYFGETPAYEIPDDKGEQGSGSKGSGDESSYVPKNNTTSGNVSGGGGGSSSKDSSAESGGNGDAELPTGKPSDAFSEELKDYWGRSEVSYMIDNGYLNGSEGKLNLQSCITRAEALAVAARMFGFDEEKYTGCFDDVNEADWFAVYMEAAYNNGLICGYDGAAEPNMFITREQIAKIFVNIYELKSEKLIDDSQLEYSDSEDVSEWAEKFVAKCSKLGVMTGYDDGTFKPLSNITRGEAFVAMYRLFDLMK